MKCRSCGELYDEDMFPVCPYCLAENQVTDVPENTDDQPDKDLIAECDVAEIEMCADAIDEYVGENTLEPPANILCDELLDEIDEVGIEEVASLSMRCKNLLRRNGIFSLKQLKEVVESNQLDKLKGLGKLAEAEILNALENIVITKNDLSEKDIPEKGTRIRTIFHENRFNMFVKYCTEHSMEYMTDLDGFDFFSLLDVRGMGKSKIMDIIKTYEQYDSGNIESNIEIPDKRTECLETRKLFGFINSQLLDLDISFLAGLGIDAKSVTILRKSGYFQIKDLKDISAKRLEWLVGKGKVKRFENTEEGLKNSFLDLFENVLLSRTEEDDYGIVLKKSSGYTLQRLGEEYGLTRERIRQRITKFNRSLSPFMRELVNMLMYPKNYVTLQELLDIYENEDFSKVIAYWCKEDAGIEYLDFADVFVRYEEERGSTESKILRIVEDFIGEGINVYDNLEELELLMENNGFPYMDGVAVVNLARNNGYKTYGDYIVKGKKSYGYLCAQVVAERFPNGIKLYDKKDLDLLRAYVLEKYGPIGVSDDDRALSTRLSDYLVLSGRGTVTAESNIQLDMTVLEAIKEYIDGSPEGEIYYSELFSRHEGMLRMLSNIDNYNFLHGVLKLYYANEYDFSNRDYLRKRGDGFKSGKVIDKIHAYIDDVKRPVSRKEIKSYIPGLTDIALANALLYDKVLFQWDYNFFYSLDILQVSSEDEDYIVNEIETIMKATEGYCSDMLLYETILRNGKGFLEKNGIENAYNLFSLCQKLFADKYDFRRPHIGMKGIFNEMSVKGIALHLLGYPEELSFPKYQEIANRLRWSAVTVGIVFSDIEKEYVRVSADLYMKKDRFFIDEHSVAIVEKEIDNMLAQGYLSLINLDIWDDLPPIQYEWNSFLLRSIIELYLPRYTIIETKSRDRRFERGIVVYGDSGYVEYADLIVDLLKGLNYYQIAENDLLTFLIIKNLTYKMIPKELYTANQIKYEDGIFTIKAEC